MTVPLNQLPGAVFWLDRASRAVEDARRSVSYMSEEYQQQAGEIRKLEFEVRRLTEALDPRVEADWATYFRFIGATYGP